MGNAVIQYRDIIFHRHHVSQSRAHMTVHSRAAQFAPFAALTGYDEIISESARTTEDAPELGEGLIADLNDRLVFLLNREDASPATVTYFVPDPKKPGGKILCLTDRLLRYDAYAGKIIFASGIALPVERIVNVESDEFEALRF